jgi:hypothetical protein
MLKDYFGKMLFPCLHPSQYNHRFKIVAATISLGLIVAGSLIMARILRGAVGQWKFPGSLLCHHLKSRRRASMASDVKTGG